MTKLFSFSENITCGQQCVTFEQMFNSFSILVISATEVLISITFVFVYV